MYGKYLALYIVFACLIMDAYEIKSDQIVMLAIRKLLESSVLSIIPANTTRPITTSEYPEQKGLYLTFLRDMSHISNLE